jgi:hypothetical protein
VAISFHLPFIDSLSGLAFIDFSLPSINQGVTFPESRAFTVINLRGSFSSTLPHFKGKTD